MSDCVSVSVVLCCESVRLLSVRSHVLIVCNVLNNRFKNRNKNLKKNKRKSRESPPVASTWPKRESLSEVCPLPLLHSPEHAENTGNANGALLLELQHDLSQMRMYSSSVRKQMDTLDAILLDSESKLLKLRHATEWSMDVETSPTFDRPVHATKRHSPTPPLRRRTCSVDSDVLLSLVEDSWDNDLNVFV